MFLKRIMSLSHTPLLLCLSLMLFAGSHASAKPPVYSDIMPLSQVKAGMKGYGLTTFKGTTISRFAVTIVGILKKENSGHDLILIRMKGGPITERGANLIQGMSGSPIYIHGKVIGAFSMGEEFPKEPVGMVTPIEDMLEAWDPDIPQKPSYFQPAERHAGIAMRRNEAINLPRPITIAGRKLTRIVLNASRDSVSTSHSASLHLASTLLSVSGIDDTLKAWFQKELTKRGFGLTVTGGGAGDSGFKGVPLIPGSAFGTFLSTGDIQIGGTGTVTYRRGNRMLGFGHPLFGLGALNAAITSASIVDIFAGFQVSHHIAIAGPVVGTLEQDRDFSVSGEIGIKPAMIPVSITVHDATTNRNQSFSCQIFQNPDLTPLLLRLVARSAIRRVHSAPGDVMAKVATSIQADDVGKITRFNTYFDSNDISTTATTDIGEITNITSSNPFAPLPIRRMDMYVDISNGHNTAGIERIFLKQGKYEPGDTLDIGVALKPYRGEQQVQNIKIKIPADVPTGRYQLLVRGGQANIIRFGSFSFSSGPQDQRTPPVNVHQMVNRLKDKEKNTDLVTVLLLNTAAPALEGEKLTQLPPNISALMRSDRNSGVRLERDEVRHTESTPYIVSGQQQLTVMVVRKNTQEPSAPNNYSGPNAQSGVSTSQPSLPGAGSTGSPFNEESAQENTYGRIPFSENAVASPNGVSNSLVFSSDVQRWMAAMLLPPNPPKTKQKQSAPPTPTAAKMDPKIIVTVERPEVSVPVIVEPVNDKPVGRQVQVWRQTAKTDFAAGKFDGSSVTSAGQLELAPTLKLLSSTPETYIWSLASAPDGSLYAGTGTSGKILKILPGGQTSLYCQLPVVSVQSLLLAKDGSLWAGSGLKGRVYRITSDGKFTLVCTLRENYILSMVQNSLGDIYLGVGGSGSIYKIPSSDQIKTAEITPILVMESKSDHILCMTVDSKDNVYAGAGNAGILYKISKDGKATALYDAKDNAITACTADSSGNIYIGTGPHATINRIAADGTATLIFDKPGSFYTAMRSVPDGSIYASTVNTVYHIYPSKNGSWQHTTILPLDNPREVDFLSIAVLPNGGVAAGTGNVGEVYTSHPASAEKQVGTFESVIHDAKIVSQWGEIRWQGSFPIGLTAHVFTRTGPLSEPDISWSKWEPVQMTAGLVNEGRVQSPPARFIQYRIQLEGSANQNLSENTPGIREISIGYMPKNQPPRVVFQSPLGGEIWSHSQQLRWQAVDSDNDSLVYTLSCSTDDGVSWKPIESLEYSKADDKGKTTPVQELKKKLDQDSSISDKLKSAIIQGANATPSVSSLKSGSALKENSKRWDTSRIPDGTYRLRVTASDSVSNAVDPLTAEAVSEPFIVCNSLPVIAAPQVTYTSDHRVQISGLAVQILAAIIGVQYKVDGGDWTAAIPGDGLFDSSKEGYRLISTPLSQGKHNVEIQVFNSAGNHNTEKISIDVP